MAITKINDPLVPPPGDFAAYIFDCDGTLAASMALHHKSWNYAIQQQVPSFEFEWNYFCSMGGMSTTETVLALNDRFGMHLEVKKVLDDYDDHLNKHLDDVEPCENVVAFAREVARQKFPVAVASGGFRRYVERTLRAIGVADIFPVVVATEDVLHSKPAPDLFLLAAKRMDVAPERCLVIEDSPKGRDAADAAGMTCLLVTPR